MGPLLEQAVGAPARASGRGVSAREVYAASADCEGCYASPAATRALHAELDVAAGLARDTLASQERAVAAWAATERDRYLELTLAVEARDLLLHRAVLGAAPLGLVSGAWLQWCSAPHNAHEDAALAVLALYASDIDVGNPHATRGDAFLEVLRQLHLADHAAPATCLVHDHRVQDVAFLVPAVLLAMGRRPDDFAPELLGADLCLRTVGLLPPLAVLEVAGDVHPDWAALDPSRERGLWRQGGLDQCRAAVDRLVDGGPDGTGDRVAAGFGWARWALADWSDRLRAELAGLDPAREMARLLRRRGHEGAMYHHDVVLGGRPLSQWLAECDDDPRPLLDVLASSELVRPGDAGSSALATDLVGEHGPMFRIFTREDLAVVRRWIDALPRSGNRNAAEPPTGPPTDLPTSLVTAADHGRTPGSVRDAYHLLQQRSLSPSLSAWAEGYAGNWLAEARPERASAERQLPERWAPGCLRPWLAHQHGLHAKEFEAGADAAVQSLEALVDSTVQTAPLTLIDGAWLRGFTDHQFAATELGRYLFAIYWDELGNGLPAINHPRIYRDLLESMGVHLPPTGSPEFAASPLLRDESFELPVFWLSIGCFPRTFAPEIVGLNLAVELAGVGGGYRLAHLSLRHHGFDTQFVDLHNAIDNVLTGHSAWAAEAVETFVAGVGDLQGARAQDEAWQRVRTGFASLEAPLRHARRPAARRFRRRPSTAAGP